MNIFTVIKGERETIPDSKHYWNADLFKAFQREMRKKDFVSIHL